MSLVLDSSVTVAWAVADEAAASVRAIFEQVAEQGAWVPSLWRLEVANALSCALRRRRISAALRDAALADLALLDIGINPECDGHAWNTTLSLADRFRLTLYDAAYLELAHRRALPLASLDRELRAAARTLAVRLLP